MTVVEAGGHRQWLRLIGSIVALILVACVGYWLASQQQSTGELRSDISGMPAGPETAEATPASHDRSQPRQSAQADADSAPTGQPMAGRSQSQIAETGGGIDDDSTSAVVVGEPSADDGRPAGYDGDAPFAIFEGGVLTLYGKVPSQELADRYEERFGNIVGPENVVNNYTIDPAFVLGAGQTTPVYVTDAVLFDFNSIALKPEYLYLLDYGALMLRQNPQATLTIVTYTDAAGSAETNLEVARLRAEQVLDYWIRNGVNPDQVLSDPRGEDGASDEDDEVTAAQRRRAEFVITGLLD